MSKSDLKAAMESLQVKKPLKLQGRQPQFKAPVPIEEPTPVSLETQVGPETKVDASTPVPIQTQVDLPTPVVLSTQVATEPQAPAATPVTVPTPVPEATLAPTATPVVAQTKVQPTERDIPPLSAGGQDSSVTLEAQATPNLHKGYTRIPNSFVMRMVEGDLLRSEMQVLLLIARFTISYNKRHAPLSKAVLERKTGLRGPAVLQAISDLLAKGLIEKIPGDQYRPNMLGLAFADEWDFFPNERHRSLEGASVATATQVSRATSAPVAGAAPAGVSGATHFKERETIENKNSLSDLPENLLDYFAELKPAKKRESEWRAFQGLRAEYSAADIADCLAFVHERGIRSGDNNQPCHSPMAFLSKAIAEVMPEIEVWRRKNQERVERERRETEARHKTAENEAHEAAEWAMKERAFAKALPGEDRQREVLAELLRNLPFRPDTQAGRNMAVGRWWQSLNEYERQELTGS